MIRARVVGAGGFGGANIIELLTAHPEAQIVSLVDVAGVGQPVSARHTHLKGICDLPVTAPDRAFKDDSVDVVFSATPDGVGMMLAEDCVQTGARLIDYSGDFRFNSIEAYGLYAQRIGREERHAAESLLPDSVYGLTELHRAAIAEAPVVGNPGCFAVSSILGAAPAVQEDLIHRDTLIFDAKTGVSGAGIQPAPTFHYPLRYENMNAYKIAAHQHNFEIERELSLLAGEERPSGAHLQRTGSCGQDGGTLETSLTAGEELHVTLTTQVVPLCRGMMTTIYGQLKSDTITGQQLYEAYAAFYRDSRFVRVEPPETPVSNNDVRGSNSCVLSVNVDPRTKRLIVVSHIDNLMKGQAGSALQNMNVMFGLDETLGLRRPPFYP